MLMQHYKKLQQTGASDASENPFAGKRVLDIGCHVGSVSLEIASRYEPLSVIGCDIDSKMIEVAVTNLQRVVNNTESIAVIKSNSNDQKASEVADQENNAMLTEQEKERE